MNNLVLTIDCAAKRKQLKNAFDAAITALVFNEQCRIILLIPEHNEEIKHLKLAAQTCLENFGTDSIDWFTKVPTEQHLNFMAFTNKPCLSLKQIQTYLSDARTVINF
ncbi:hypothetical protein SAMN02745866_01913 [Alteromonadaceae bacterium Bs31]|nr:hypothetical protein SAMN02745866_01913 [Alteromonadaceae bacterium Bs31]